MVWELETREEAVMGRSTLLKLFLVPACVHIYMYVCGGEREEKLN